MAMAPLFGKKHSEKTRNKIAKTLKAKGIKPPNIKGLFVGENNPSKRPEVREKISKALAGKKKAYPAWNKGLHLPSPSGETRIKRRNSMLKKDRAGEKNPNWKGGRKLTRVKVSSRRRNRGFIPLIDPSKVKYDDYEWHHVDPNLPYAVPCPTHIHKMFPWSGVMHFQNVNAMLGIIRIEDIDTSWFNFKKRTPWNKGKQGIKTSNKGQIPWNKGKKGSIPWNKGKTGVYSEETRNKISQSLKGNIPWNKGKPSGFRSKHHSEERKIKISKS